MEKKAFFGNRLISDIILIVLISLCLSIILNKFIFNITSVKGESMSPTLQDGDKLVMDRFGSISSRRDYNRGDIIVFSSPTDRKKFLVKRIIGLPNDKISIIDGKLYVNDKKIDEPYVEDGIYTESIIIGKDYIVPEDEYFVMGDNRLPSRSNDSRFFGSILKESIKGKIIFRIAPVENMRKL